jgi:hypothetical protein
LQNNHKPGPQGPFIQTEEDEMERKKLGYMTFNQNFHRGYCALCGKTPKIVASDTNQSAAAKKTIEHMDSVHNIRAAEFMGVVYENHMGRPPMSD